MPRMEIIDIYSEAQRGDKKPSNQQHRKRRALSSQTHISPRIRSKWLEGWGFNYCTATGILLSIVVAILVNGPQSVSAGFACLSNPCVFGVCIDDLNRWVSRWLETELHKADLGREVKNKLRHSLPNPEWHYDGGLHTIEHLIVNSLEIRISYQSRCPPSVFSNHLFTISSSTEVGGIIKTSSKHILIPTSHFDSSTFLSRAHISDSMSILLFVERRHIPIKSNFINIK